MVVTFPIRGGATDKPVSPSRPAQVVLKDHHFDDASQDIAKHSAEPIKSVEDIIKVQEYFIKNKKYRDNLLFTLGINVGLRCGDLVQVKVGHLLTEDGSSYRDSFTIREGKTNKVRTCYLNDAVYDAADLYFANAGEVSLNDFLFKSASTRDKDIDQPLSVVSVERILKAAINDECQLSVRASTHCLRKTFAYHVIMTAQDRSRAIEFLQKILGHSSQSITLRYAGITDDEIRETYKGLCLGKASPFGWTAHPYSNDKEVAAG